MDLFQKEYEQIAIERIQKFAKLHLSLAEPQLYAIHKEARTIIQESKGSL